jgi:hypothetical protein
LPIYRKGIYQSFISHGRPQAVARLALAAARFVFPLWQAKRPNDALILQTIRTGELLLEGRGNVSAARKTANRAWKFLEALGSTEAGFGLGNAFDAATAASASLLHILGRDPFGDIEIDEHTSDDELDPWASDTAKWAANAYAGIIGQPESDAAKRLAFWTWWLNEAIPLAWQASAPARE